MTTRKMRLLQVFQGSTRRVCESKPAMVSRYTGPGSPGIIFLFLRKARLRGEHSCQLDLAPDPNRGLLASPYLHHANFSMKSATKHDEDRCISNKYPQIIAWGRFLSYWLTLMPFSGGLFMNHFSKLFVCVLAIAAVSGEASAERNTRSSVAKRALAAVCPAKSVRQIGSSFFSKTISLSAPDLT